MGLVVGSWIDANTEDLEIAPDKKFLFLKEKWDFSKTFLQSWTVSCGKEPDKVQNTNSVSTSGRRKEEEQVSNRAEIEDEHL